MARSTRRLLIVFVSLLAVTVVYRAIEHRSVTSRTTGITRLDASDVTKIEISGKPGDEVTLQLQGDRWMVTAPVTWPADQKAVTDMLDQAADMKATNLVSSNPENHDLYEVGGQTGLLVRLLGGADGGKRLFSFYVGKMTSDFSHTYIREFGSDEVYAAVGLLSGYFKKSVSNWRDRTILAEDAAAIQRIIVSGPDVAWELVRGGPGGPAWDLETEGATTAADSVKAAGILRNVVRLTATGFPGAAAAGTDWSTPTFTIRLVRSDGSETGVIGVPATGEETSKVWLRKQGEDTAYEMYRSTLDSILRKPEDLAGK